MSDSERRTETTTWTTSFRAGVFAWPSVHRELLHACVAAGVHRRLVRARWRGLAVHVDLVLEGERDRVRVLQRYVGDLVAQA